VQAQAPTKGYLHRGADLLLMLQLSDLPSSYRRRFISD